MPEKQQASAYAAARPSRCFMKLGGDFLQGVEDALEDVAKGPSSPGGASATLTRRDQPHRACATTTCTLEFAMPGS